jgi:mono/diheme cytochrome c family protein
MKAGDEVELNNMTKQILSLLALLSALNSLASEVPATLSFMSNGKLVHAFTLDDLKRRLAVKDVTVFEPQIQKNVTFKAFATDDLLNLAYGNDWQSKEEILFTCVDGYQPSMPRADFRDGRSYFAFARSDGAAFVDSETRDHQKNVALGPFYLIWDNLSDKKLQASGTYGWPFQIAAVDLVRFVDKFPKLAPPAGSSATVVKGFSDFREYCMECHALRGEGGGRGPELTAIVPTMTDELLASRISDPKKVNSTTSMPSFNPALKGEERKKAIGAIIAYLRSMN